ncbi:MAG: ABC transporter ATP-binding protein [Candidatus Heimdallarchaeota archaeon]|nr:ABC transporter ATP-binding protein [Candidatus Heimdallarchaeota archaeon]
MSTQLSEFSLVNPFNTNRSGPIRWIVSHTLRNKFFIFMVISFQIISSLSQSIIPGLIGTLFGLLVKNTLTLDLLTDYSIQILIYGLAIGLMVMMRNIAIEFIGQRIERDTRDELYASLMGKSLTWHDKQQIGDLMSRAATDVRQLNFMINPGVNLVFASIVSALFPLIFIGMINYQLLLVPILYLISFLIVLRWYNKQLKPPAMESRQAVSKINARLNEVINGIHVVRGASKENGERAIFQKNIKEFETAQVKLGETQAKYYPLLMLGVANAVGILHGIFLLNHSAILFEDLVTFILLLNLLRFPTFINIFALTMISLGIAAGERVLELINGESKISDNSDGYAAPISGDIEFRNVTFGYSDDLPVLKNISFKVSPGQTIALVGVTGSGKTTITKLLSRLYDPQEGQILIDGKDLKEWSIESLRSQMALVEQDVFLFSKSAIDNITLGMNGVPKSDLEVQVIEAAKMAHAHEFIMNLPEGYETVIGERGSTISGGQKQRIAIARAIIRDPAILILDDSSSSIDSKTEDEINNAIRNVLKNRVSFIITHRIAQIRKADHIILFDQGEIINQGSHEYLMKNSDEYKMIFSIFDKEAK